MFVLIAVGVAAGYNDLDEIVRFLLLLGELAHLCDDVDMLRGELEHVHDADDVDEIPLCVGDADVCSCLLEAALGLLLELFDAAA